LIPCLTLTDEREDLKAQQMVCSYLVRACRQAMYELALEDQSDPDVRHRAVQVLTVVHQDWLEAQKAVARELRTNSNSPGVAAYLNSGRVSNEGV
jgi:hypothetical protein